MFVSFMCGTLSFFFFFGGGLFDLTSVSYDAYSSGSISAGIGLISVSSSCSMRYTL